MAVARTSPDRISPGRISPARKAAYRILLVVERGEGHSDDLLRGKAVSALAPADRNLATALVLGVLRWQLLLDAQIRPLLKRPNAKVDDEILIALRLGAFQLLFLDRIPAHAAIDESVELARQAGQRYASGMVNAVLRKLSSMRTREAREHDPASSYPEWMAERWKHQFGEDAACAICAHGQAQPRLSLRVSNAEDATELAEAGTALAPGELLTAARTVVSGDVTATTAFREGRVRIQDEGSQLIGEIAACAATTFVKKHQKILDACAAPGGKTLILAERLPAAQIVACEASVQRLAQLTKRLTAYAGRVECRFADATALAEEAKFDLALADVPCSGTGTLGRNPEIRHRLRSEDLPRQAERQRAILRAALRAVKPGGRVVYSTCSLEPEENEQVIAAVLREEASVRQVSLGDCIEQMQRTEVLVAGAAERLTQCIAAKGELRLLPGAFGTDGFFVALLERSA
jgi:16S rRNA (cytosine967-C5)-methyltransferase